MPDQERLQLNNKVALISGSTRGIGRAIARILSENGAKVFINGRNERDIISTINDFKKLGLHINGYAADISNESEVRQFVKNIVNEVGRIDILINNAGISEILYINEMSLESWNRFIKNNLTSVFLMCREVLPLMKTQRGGKIINI